jgi:hypothetical protein
MNEWSASRRDRYLHDTQQTGMMEKYILNGIRTRFPSNPAAADLRLRLHCHRYRPLCKYLYLYLYNHDNLNFCW